MTLRGALYSKQLASSDSHDRDVLVHHDRAARRVEDLAQDVAGRAGHRPPPSAHARMPRSAHMRAYSCSDASTPFGIAPSEWLMR
jgi:hypothetical protein